jgi:hypothetical protein
VRENAPSWKGLLLDLKRRGLVIGPELAIADGALGFWQAIGVYDRFTEGFDTADLKAAKSLLARKAPPRSPEVS